MIYQCRYCLYPMRIYPGQATICQCGAIYTAQMVTGNSSGTTLRDWGNEEYDSLHRNPARQYVPQAFYKAFEGEEAWQ